jgi:predicted dehydrogenase
MTIRFGVAGLRFGKTWARAAAWHRDTCLVAICDPQPEPTAELLAELAAEPAAPRPRTYTAYERLIADPEVDAIALFTPAPLHASQATAALAAGKHVLSAVPAAMSVEECRLLVRAVQETGRAYMLAENWPYVPSIMRARALYRQGKLGRIFYAEAEYVHDLRPLWLDAAGRPTWRRNLSPLLYPTHGTAPYLHMTGDRFVEATAMAVSGDAVQAAPAADIPPPAETAATEAAWLETALFRTAAGALFRLTNTFRNAAASGHFYSFYGTRGTFETGRQQEAARRAVYCTEDSGTPRWVREECPPVQATSYRRPVTGGHAATAALILDDFIRALRTGQPPPIDVVAAVNMTLPGICGHQAAVERRPVAIPDPRAWIPE